MCEEPEVEGSERLGQRLCALVDHQHGLPAPVLARVGVDEVSGEGAVVAVGHPARRWKLIEAEAGSLARNVGLVAALGNRRFHRAQESWPQEVSGEECPVEGGDV